MARDALNLGGVDAFYGDGHVLHNVSFTVGEGRLLGLIGRNGAGKTTCMNVAVGLLPPRAGRVAVFGSRHRPRGARGHCGARCRPGAAGAARVPEPDGAREPERRRAQAPKG